MKTQSLRSEQILAWVAGIFEEPLENLRLETRRDEIPGWDSLGVLSLMAALDEKFEVRLSQDEIGGLASVADILSLLRSRGILSV